MGTDQPEVVSTVQNNNCMCPIFRILFDEKQTYVTAAKALLSNYLIESEELDVGDCIGVGSSGVVYKGFYKGQHVAVKVLNGTLSKGSIAEDDVLQSKSDSQGDSEMFRRSKSDSGLWRNKTEGEFRREVLSLISCAHKNILKLYGVCISSHLSICIVTKFMQGGSLLHYLQQRTSLKICEILKLAKDVAKGMEFLHSRGIVHRDLKTANVFLDEERNAVIGDLGVARLVNEVEEGGREIGTYRWMAPEVCRAESGRGGGGEGFSYKSDVYSYGILVWELVTCKMPFADYNPVQAAVGVVMHGLRPAFPPACFPPLRYLIQKCWDQDPSVRPHFSQILKMLNIISQQNWS
eukprot:c24783_g1_i2 orf=712-1761(-)